MGTYNKWYIDVDTNDPILLQKIIEDGRRIDGNTELSWDQYCFRKWSAKDNWVAFDLVKQLSNLYPNIIFSVEYSGENGSSKLFYLDGYRADKDEIWEHPTFPSVPLLKKVISKIHNAALLREQKEKKEKAEREAKEKKDRIAQLEAELKSLKRK